MFHLMLVLPYLAAYAFVLTIPYWVGGGLQFILTICCNRKRFLLIPTILGVIGLVLSLWFLSESIPIQILLIYWGIYLLILLLVWAVVRAVRKAFLRQIDRRVEEKQKNEPQ